MFSNIIIQLALSPLDTLETAEAQQMGLPDIGNQTEIRLRHINQMRDVVRMTGPHLNDRQLGRCIDH